VGSPELVFSELDRTRLVQVAQRLAADSAVTNVLELDFPSFCRHFSASSVKLLECQRAQKVEMTVPAGSIVKPFYVIEHL
jgi:hypothetical protein